LRSGGLDEDTQLCLARLPISAVIDHTVYRKIIMTSHAWRNEVPGVERLVHIRACHGYIPEECIHALYPYPLRIRAEDAYPKGNMRKRGEDISILSDKKCEILSDPYPRYENQGTGMYKIVQLLAMANFRQDAVDLFFHVQIIRGSMCKRVAASSGDPTGIIQL